MCNSQRRCEPRGFCRLKWCGVIAIRGMMNSLYTRVVRPVTNPIHYRLAPERPATTRLGRRARRARWNTSTAGARNIRAWRSTTCSGGTGAGSSTRPTFRKPLRLWNIAIRTGTPHYCDQRLRRHDGEYRWFLCRGEPVRDTDGSILRWSAPAPTWTTRGGCRTSCAACGRCSARLVERCEDGFVVAGADGMVRYANPAAAALLDYTPEELVGTDLWCSVHPDDRAGLMDWLRKLVESAGSRMTISVRFAQHGIVALLDVFGTNLLPDPDVRGSRSSCGRLRRRRTVLIPNCAP